MRGEQNGAVSFDRTRNARRLEAISTSQGRQSPPARIARQAEPRREAVPRRTPRSRGTRQPRRDAVAFTAARGKSRPMSHVPAHLRRLVIRRAGNRCEYCLLSQTGQEATFHIDPIVPESRDGETDEDNLALACVSC